MHCFKNYILFILFITISNSVYSQSDNLEPESDIFSVSKWEYPYYSKIRTVLYDSLNNVNLIRIIVIPPFSNEYIVSIDVNNKDTMLLYRIANNHIWRQNGDKSITFEESKIKLDSRIAQKIHDLFFIAISNVRYFDHKNIIEDGTKYIFIAFEEDYGTRSGSTHSPENEKLRGLINVTDWLVKCAKEKEILNQYEMNELVDFLILKFKEK